MRLTNAILVSTVCAFTTVALADQSSATKAAPAAQADAAGQTSLVKISSIEGKAANDEFTRNVQVLQAERQEIVKLNESTNAAPAGKARDQLQAQLDSAVKRLDADNQTMAKTYGYSILRNYVRIPESSDIYIVLTEEEIAKQPASKDGSAPSKTLKVATLNDAQANQSFQTAVQNLQQLRQQAAAMKATLDASTDSKDKAYQQGQFDLLLKQLNEANAAATKTYAFNLNRQYVMSIEKSTLYIAATPEEAAKVQQSEDAAAKSAAKSDAKPAAKADGKGPTKTAAKGDAKGDAKSDAKPAAPAKGAKTDAKTDAKGTAKTDAKTPPPPQ